MGGLRAAGGALKALTVLATAVAVVVVGIPGVGEASTTTTLDDVGPWTSASAVSYTASWLTSKGSGKYGGSDHYSNTAGAAATISVSGTAICRTSSHFSDGQPEMALPLTEAGKFAASER